MDKFLNMVTELNDTQREEVLHVLEKMRDGDTTGMLKEEYFRKSLKRALNAMKDVLLLTGIEAEGEPVYLEKNENTRGAAGILSRMLRLAEEIDYFLLPVTEEGEIERDGEDLNLNDTRLSSGDLMEVLTEDEDGNEYWISTGVEYDSERGTYYFTRLPSLPIEKAIVRLK